MMQLSKKMNHIPAKLWSGDGTRGISIFSLQVGGRSTIPILCEIDTRSTVPRSSKVKNNRRSSLFSSLVPFK
jgi:hypothetical protein